MIKFERPTYLISREICQQNIRMMAEKAARSGIIFRPHFKTHQSLTIGRWFREAGIRKITVSSLIAAEYFAADCWEDITIAFPVNLREIGLINRLGSKVRIGLLVEHPDVAAELENQLTCPVDIYIKIDTGYHRTGLMPEEMPLILELASIITASSKMTMKGLLTHAGHTYHASPAGEIHEIYHSSVQILNSLKDNLRSFQPELILSYGDTPSCTVMNDFPDIDEMRPGNFIFYDLMQLTAGVCNFSQVAGIVICPVVAVHAERNQVVLYGGAIHFSKDYVRIDGRTVYGQLVQVDEQGWQNPVPGAYIVSLSQEHGILEAPDEVVRDLRPGAVVGIIPVHSCLTASLMQGYQLTGGGLADYFSGI